MHRLFTALLLVGIFTLSSATSHEKVCKNFTGKPYLNGTAFFKGTWSLTHALIPDVPKGAPVMGICLYIKSILSPPIVFQNYTTMLPSTGEIVYGQGIIVLKDGDSNFVSNIRLIEDGQPASKFNPFIETIIGTDYENYAVGYFCLDVVDSMFTGTIAVLGRSSDPDKIHPDVNNVLNKIGLKLSDLVSTIRGNCPEV
ncbi:hypothetical protein O3M35_004903 [Rhynocoris fuscipes]|uniref:Uncharacterized protein n=1 Tax=Rhynocoris fuscipes TaxID=488301 RepID=A0AAW1DNW1_9HEMI